MSPSNVLLSSPRGLVRELLQEVLRLRCNARVLASGAALEDCEQELAQADVLVCDVHEMPARALADFNTRRKFKFPRLRVFTIEESLEKGGVDLLLEAVRGADPTGPASLAKLTPLETEVLIAVASGMRNSEIARSMRRSSKTVEKHRANLQRKLGLRNAVQLTAYSLSHGLVHTDVILATRPG